MTMTTATVGEVVKRKCQVQGRDGQFALLRKNTQNSMVRPIDANNQFAGPAESVDTNLLYNEKVLARPSKPPKGDQVYAADRPLRRICLLKGHGDDEQYHLIRKTADHSKVLRVGAEGVGEWVLNSQIREEYTQPVAVTKTRATARQPVRICEINGRPGEKYLLVRKTPKMARVIGPIVGDNFGETIDPTLIVNEQKISRRKAAEAVAGAGEGMQSEPQDGEGGYTEAQGESYQEPVSAPVTQPVAQPAPAPVVQAPVQPAPVQQAPVQQAPRPQPAPAAPQGQPVQRPAQPVQGQPPRPQGAPQGQPVQRPAGQVPQGQPRPQPAQGQPRPQQVPVRPGVR